MIREVKTVDQKVMDAAKPGIIIIALGGLVGLIGDLATGSPYSSPYVYIASAMMLAGFTIALAKGINSHGKIVDK
ncbi:MAG TPA: hypothetical protein K8W20_12220 [Pseudomonas lactis]|jgi:hypothetical protein|uniref:Uncharacterized protein n=1 Tax=Pseudomonas lactis TaxID=1615674 RepID=A0A921NI64_9PSED|nr:hypothetical protein [Pseudomonas lactis]HJH19467.1 hypothetical protein [Pseudomonas lactis]